MTRLIDCEPELALFAEGLNGNYLHIKGIGEFTGTAPTPDVAGQTLDTLYLPDELEGHSSGYRVLALQQICQRNMGTYRFRLADAEDLLEPRSHEEPSVTNPNLSRRQSEFQRLFQRYEHPVLIAQLFQLYETVRIDCAMLQAYPGMRKHYAQFYANQGMWLLLAESLTSLDELIRASVEHGQQFAPEQNQTIATQNPLLEILVAPFATLAPPAGKESSVLSSVLAADKTYHQVAAAYAATVSETILPLEETTEDWMQRQVRLEDWDDDLARMNQQLMAAQMMQEAAVDAAEAEGEIGQERPEGMELRSLTEERDTQKRRLDMEQSAIRHALGNSHPDTKSYLYDEWDYNNHRYLHSYCRLYEQDIDIDDSVDTNELLEPVRRWQNEIKQRLSMIKPLGLQRMNRVDDGDELDFNALLQARLDLRSGISPDERIYSRRERLRRDLGAAFLVDLSASTDDPLEKPEADYDLDEDDDSNLRDPYDDIDFDVVEEKPRRIIDVQREAMLVMSTALESLGDDYGVYGFSGYGRDCVEFYVAKEMGEAFRPATLKSIASMQPKRSTRMGPAIRHAARKLISAGYAQKLLLILSDGFPQDCDYGPQRGDHEYGLQDTAKALEEAENKGISTFCVTVDRSGHDYLKRMCPSENYMVIDEIEGLPAALTKVYQALAGR